MRAHRLLLVVVSVAVLLLAWAPAALAVQPLNVAVSKVTPISAVIVVKTDVVSDVVIDYGSAPGAYTAQKTSAASSRHEVLLDGLAPSSRVYYRVTITATGNTATGNPADSQVLAESSFPTTKPPGVPFSFGAAGDSRPNWIYPYVQPQVWGTILSQMQGEGLDLVIHTGDLIYASTSDTAAQNETKYDGFFAFTMPLTQSVPLYPTIGNHEWITVPVNRAGYEREFTLPENNGPAAATEGEDYYSFDYGDTHFIALCTELPGQVGLVTGDQLTWLAQDLAANDKQWTVVFLHRPFFASRHTSDPWIDPANSVGQANRNQLLGLFQQYGVDVVFEGHEHNYHHHVDNGIQYVICGGGGAPLYDLLPFGPGDIFGAKAYHHVKVDETPDSLKLTAIDASGGVLESFTLGTPGLGLGQNAVYWGSYNDYLAGLLSVDYTLADNGPGDAAAVDVVYLSATNGVTPVSSTPLSLGGIAAGGSTSFTIQYLVPPGVGFFRATTFVSCTDLAGNTYAYPGPAPVL